VAAQTAPDARTVVNVKAAIKAGTFERIMFLPEFVNQSLLEPAQAPPGNCCPSRKFHEFGFMSVALKRRSIRMCFIPILRGLGNACNGTDKAIVQLVSAFAGDDLA
jgi:hypothetical protein